MMTPSTEPEVSLSLPRDDWEWLLENAVCLNNFAHPRVDDGDDGSDRHRMGFLLSLLRAKCRRHKAAQPAGTATDVANVVLDEMKILNPPEPIARDSR